MLDKYLLNFWWRVSGFTSTFHVMGLLVLIWKYIFLILKFCWNITDILFKRDNEGKRRRVSAISIHYWVAPYVCAKERPGNRDNASRFLHISRFFAIIFYLAEFHFARLNRQKNRRASRSVRDTHGARRGRTIFLFFFNQTMVLATVCAKGAHLRIDFNLCKRLEGNALIFRLELLRRVVRARYTCCSWNAFNGRRRCAWRQAGYNPSQMFYTTITFSACVRAIDQTRFMTVGSPRIISPSTRGQLISRAL